MFPMNRVMDRAYIWDRKVMHTGEAVLLACLVHVTPRTKRGQEEIDQIRKLMKWPTVLPPKED